MRGPWDDLHYGGDPKKLTHDQLRTIFTAAAMYQGSLNAQPVNVSSVHASRDSGPRSRPMTPADIQKLNKTYWDGQLKH
jgi:hypothetical protein